MQCYRCKKKRRRSHRRPRRPRLGKETKRKTVEPFSLSRRGRLKSSRQVSWLGLFPTGRAFPSLDLLGTVALICGFRRPYSGGTAPDSHRTSLEPKARREIYRAPEVVKMVFSLALKTTKRTARSTNTARLRRR
jgi:hypothetical protein